MQTKLANPHHVTRFSLRMLFVLLTLTCVVLSWLGWNWWIVRERQIVWRQIAEQGAEYTLLTGPHQIMINAERNLMPFPRNWLGDQRIPGIILPSDFDADQIAQVRAAFPEAWLCDDLRRTINSSN